MLQIFDDTESLVRAAAEHFVEEAATAVERQGYFTVALTGGSTPRPLYALLATETYRDRVEWSRVHVFWGDERCVPPDDALSNARMAREALLDHVPVPAGQVHAVDGVATPAQGAASYEAQLRETFGRLNAWHSKAPDAERYPRFDLVLLGLGDDAHLASLFPGEPALYETKRLAVDVYPRSQPTPRVTFTLPVINAAAVVCFVVSGANKQDAVRAALEGERDPSRYPVQAVAPEDGRLLWMIDQPAAGQLG